MFYRRGFEATSFADIADMVGISRGNFYHHFKTKDEILSEVIALRLARTKAMLEAWNALNDEPAKRIRSFIGMMIANRAKIVLYGCPVGTLCNELAKLEHVAHKDARRVFTLFRDWLARQFSALGHTIEARDLALHLLARSQGVASLAAAYRDEDFVRREVDEMYAWLDAVH